MRKPYKDIEKKTMLWLLDLRMSEKDKNKKKALFRIIQWQNGKERKASTSKVRNIS